MINEKNLNLMMGRILKEYNYRFIMSSKTCKLIFKRKIKKYMEIPVKINEEVKGGDVYLIYPSETVKKK